MTLAATGLGGRGASVEIHTRCVLLCVPHTYSALPLLHHVCNV